MFPLEKPLENMSPFHNYFALRTLAELLPKHRVINLSSLAPSIVRLWYYAHARMCRRCTAQPASRVEISGPRGVFVPFPPLAFVCTYTQAFVYVFQRDLFENPSFEVANSGIVLHVG